MKFRIQKDKFSCGPVAVQNAQIALGLKPTGLKKLKKILKTKAGRGTNTVNFVKALRRLNYTLRPVRNRKRRLDSTTVIICFYEVKPGKYHYVVESHKGTHNLFNPWTRQYMPTSPLRNIKANKLEWVIRKR